MPILRPRPQPNGAPLVAAPRGASSTARQARLTLANDALDSRPLLEPSARAAAVLDPALVEAQRLPRSDAPEGREPILTATAAARVTRAFALAPHTTRARLLELVRSFVDGAAAPVQRALLLKAIAARSTSLAAPTSDALAILERFASTLRAHTRAELLVKATALDLDSTTSTSAFDPQGMWQKRGTIGDRGAHDVDKNNDGLFQRFTASCGPTTLQMALAEADPVFAFALHAHELTSDSTTDAVARFQRTLLEAHGGKAIGRREAHLRARLRNALGRSDLDEPARTALLQHALAGGPRSPPAERALTTLRARHQGFPSDAELVRLASLRGCEVDAGIDARAMLALLHEHLTPMTGVHYRVTDPKDGFARGGAMRHFDEVARALRDGIDVPFGISEPGHWMLLSALDGKKPHRRFLVSDPDGGRTAWVTEAAFARGTFGDDTFHLSHGAERPYVDSFFLPSAQRTT